VLEIDDPMEACRKLTDMACDAGGDDNITVIVARFDGEMLAEAGASPPLGYERFEYPKAGDITARSGYPKDPAAPPEEDASAEQPTAAAEQEPEQTAPAEDAAPADPAAATPAPEGEADQAEAAAEQVDVDHEPQSRGRAGPIVGMVAVVLIGAAVGGYFLTRGNAGGLDQPPASMQGAAGPAGMMPAAPGAPTAQPSAQPADVAAPPLNPIDEQQILGKGGHEAKAKGSDEATDSEASPATAGIETEFPEDSPPDTPEGEADVEQAVADSDKPAAADEPDSAGKPTGKKKPGGKKTGKGKKKKDSLIPDNPFD